ncbi:MAG: monovalent cation/H(+) antiporter subunit G [Hyphomicrobiales bacterium]|nr:MAG: monovalent cation/H(+) antiporter subunit G [Hyphomicrobiales bacterium]
MTILAALLLLAGSLFSAVAALGILRFPDIYTRLHAASKAGPLGAGLILLGAATASGDWTIVLRCALGLLFLIATSPVSAHLLARAALKSGTPLDARTSPNEYQS